MRGWRVGRILGIGIYIDPSWLLILAFLVWSLATGFFSIELRQARFRGGLNLQTLGLGFVAALLLFASVLAHELAHSYVALKRGIPVQSITLFFFGGVAQIGDEPDRPATELLIAVIGPLMSLALAVFFALFWVWPAALLPSLTPWRDWLIPLLLVGQYLTQANAALALFNLVPGFPLDGGRVLRSILWAVTGSLTRATRWAMVLGRALAAVMIVGGLASLVSWFGLGLGGLWLALVGGFVWNAAGEAYRSVLWRESLRQVTVRQIMSRLFEPVPLSVSLQDLIDRYALAQRAETFPVQAEGRVVGLVSLGSVQRIPPARWSLVSVGEVMCPLATLPPLSPDQTGLDALRLLGRTGEPELPVLEEGAFAGLLGREEISRYLRLKHRL